MSSTFFQGGQKILQGGFAPTAPPGYSPGTTALDVNFECCKVTIHALFDQTLGSSG